MSLALEHFGINPDIVKRAGTDHRLSRRQIPPFANIEAGDNAICGGFDGDGLLSFTAFYDLADLFAVDTKRY